MKPSCDRTCLTADYLEISDYCYKFSSPAVFEILRSKPIGITSLTFRGHVTSPIM